MATTNASASPASAARRGFAVPRAIWVVIALASAVVFGASLYTLVERIREFNQEELRRYAYERIYNDSFEFAGRPVTIEDLPGQNAGDLGRVRITYGDDAIELPVRIDGVDDVPDLRRHENWMHVLRFIDSTGVQPDVAEQEVLEGKRQDRLTIATRIPPPGADTLTWGEVWRTDWRFELYELLPDGGFESHDLGFPTSTRAGGPQQGELEEGTWQYGAALFTMPAGKAPKPVYGHDAWDNFGYAFPAAAVSAVVLAISLAFSFAPKRVTEPSAP